MAKNNTNLSNLVKTDALKRVQLQTLKAINDVISKTAGPYGSYTMIMHQDQLTEYSKDGHKVLKNLRFFKPLEASVHDELLGITEHVIKKVGDGTTTAVQLSYYIYKQLCEKTEEWDEQGVLPYQIISEFQSVVSDIIKEIEEDAKELEIDDIRQICLISTNGNEIVADDISKIYKEFGKDVYIQLGTSNTESSILKTYDGIILNKGFSSPSFINTNENTVEIANPRIYYFEDPVDTPEMIQLCMNIFTDNIYEPYRSGSGEYIPSVIIMPSISQDAASSLASIEQIFYSFDQANKRDNKPPFCIITGINDRVDNIGDIVTLCGCPVIKKYINPDVRKEDIAKGDAPDKDTITEFYGTCDLISIDVEKTKIVNPKNMFDNEAPINEDGSRPFSSTYASIINFLKKQIEIESQDKNNINALTILKKRLHSLTANFVEYLVGGVSAADRDNVRDLVEDAILNCRSAAISGVGYGAGLEGLLASNDMRIGDGLRREIADIIYNAYYDVMKNLYMSAMQEDEAEELVNDSLSLKKVYNLREKTFTGNQVYTSIETDIVILEAISRIITIMYTSNQALLVDPMQNAYINLDED